MSLCGYDNPSIEIWLAFFLVWSDGGVNACCVLGMGVGGQNQSFKSNLNPSEPVPKSETYFSSWQLLTTKAQPWPLLTWIMRCTTTPMQLHWPKWTTIPLLTTSWELPKYLMLSKGTKMPSIGKSNEEGKKERPHVSPCQGAIILGVVYKYKSNLQKNWQAKTMACQRTRKKLHGMWEKKGRRNFRERKKLLFFSSSFKKMICFQPSTIPSAGSNLWEMRTSDLNPKGCVTFESRRCLFVRIIQRRHCSFFKTG